MRLFPAMLEQSIIVAAHPDDEVLWFSSILDKVNEVVVCFVSNESYPWWSAGRRKSLDEYPIKNISCLNMDESGVYSGADWQNPVVTDYGLEIVRKDIPPQRNDKYRNNFDELKQRLEKRLDGYRNVFTHNPWGEYGHEEHVQVHRVIKGLQSKLGFNLWYSNYVGNKSFKFMASYRERARFDYVTCETNRALAREIREIYKRNKCWTWYGAWECPKRESFIKEGFHEEENKHSRPFPTNLITYAPPPSYYSKAKQRVKRLTKKLLTTVGIQITRVRPGKRERVASLYPERPSQGTVLLSWRVEPFFKKPGEPIPASHTDYWECMQVAQTFVDLGYAVDVIDSQNWTFVPTKPYSYFIGHRINFDRIAELLKGKCSKIAHLDTAHWVFNNQATYRRKLDLQQRKGTTLKDSHRLIEFNLAIEHADYAVMYGNQFTMDTYRYANTPIFRVPISTCALFPWPENKDYGPCRSNFLWFGSHGFVHKGLDLVLEAFADMPDYHLYVCGPLQKEKDFVKVYYKELYQTPNVHAIGWVDVNSPEFIEIVNKCVGIVYPSCSEGQAGSVTTCMHAGLIPLVSYESGIDVDDFGAVLKDNSINAIQNTVCMVSNLPSDQLRERARKAWEFARANHTRERFAEEYKTIVLNILGTAKSERSENLADISHKNEGTSK